MIIGGAILVIAAVILLLFVFLYQMRILAMLCNKALISLGYALQQFSRWIYVESR